MRCVSTHTHINNEMLRKGRLVFSIALECFILGYIVIDVMSIF